MLRLAVLLLLAATAALVCEAQTTGCGRSKVGLSRIVGGKAATKGQYPWQVDILEQKSTDVYQHHCGGTLISNQFVLTAAHCFYGETFYPTKYMIVLGEHNEDVEEGTEVKIHPSQLIINRGYNPRLMSDDIALLKLPRPINLTLYINTACLPQATENFFNNTRCVNTGWGRNFGLYSQQMRILQVVSAPLMSSAQCKHYISDVVDNVQICFGDGYRGPCFGDSGGPLACPRSDGSYAVVGIVSYAKSKTCTKYPAVFTNVAAYRSWINQHTGL